MHLNPALAYGCRYRTPTLNNLLTFTLFHHRHRNRKLHQLRLRSVRTVLAQPIITLSICRRLRNPSFLTGNCLFYKMERFWSGSSINKNKAMVEHLQLWSDFVQKVAEVMETVDRALFVPDGNPPYLDSPMGIGYNATISAPHMHATCLQLLEENLQPGMRALDVGSEILDSHTLFFCRDGYLTACFALMVGPQGRTVGVEHIPELVASSIQNIEKSAAAPLLKEGSLSVHVGDGRLGWPEAAPYDAIHVGAAAPEIPPALIEQLKPGAEW
ncbi:hypothetical protein FNV43_RR19537 [Rhamnella rubrinervis]|uniref:Protein-L-isoaspartate O-methyltransferase n=1 Tax=Rhamnella rubrinervis TaxID=2594499 RepID=A0A8K0DYY5_9ROSA|nr:hypothetical protein FNV43_RR19537 [Rhamnella rubrinervis]